MQQQDTAVTTERGWAGGSRRRLWAAPAALVAPALLLAVPAFGQAPPPPAAAAESSAARLVAVPLPFPDAVSKVARALLAKVKPPEGRGEVELVVDPLLDGATGLHTVAAAEAGRRLAEIARAEFPQIRLVPFTREALARSPLLLIGTITAAQNAEPDTGQHPVAQAPKAYTVWFTLADAGTKEIVAKAQAPAAPEGVNMSPAANEADSPAWRRDAAVQGYVESCRNAKVGEDLKPAYVAQLPVAALVAEAGRAYDSKRYQQALDLYRQAAALPGGDQLRVLNGIYLALDRLGRKKEAEVAFARLVDHGLANRDLAVKILFRPGTPQFVRSREARLYPMWLDQVAARAAARDACLEVVGHTSPTGPAAVNERISQLRAESVRDRLGAAANGLGKRIVARGAGSRENLVGTGRDDASDALDRRVEFKVLSCS